VPDPTARFLLLLSFMAPGRPITCPLCGSQNLIRLSDEEVAGTTTVVQYLCNKCHAVFARQPVKAASQEIAGSPMDREPPAEDGRQARRDPKGGDRNENPSARDFV
jgi:DNA-directed RNA polymerase subunit RPC12/RpoP